VCRQDLKIGGEKRKHRGGGGVAGPIEDAKGEGEALMRKKLAQTLLAREQGKTKKKRRGSLRVNGAG